MIRLVSWQEADYFYMSRALQLAARGEYTTAPNPRVGCIIVRDNEILGEGWHQFRGSAHAEINALDSVSANARGASCYVTLEPCNHSGHTGPCTEALISSEISRLVCAMVDPNPLVAGEGLAKLTEAGIETSSGLMEAEAHKLNPGFIMRMTQKRPFVRCKMAMSLDARTAMASGESKWITSAAARRDVQKLRAGSAAIMTGIDTVLLDDPGLDVRDENTGRRDVLRVVLDRKLRMPVSAKMLTLTGRTLVFTNTEDSRKKQQIEAAGAEVIMLEETGFLSAVLHFLAEHEEVNDVLLEAGATLSGAMLEAGLIDEIVLYQAPVILGDAARGLFHLPAITSMKDKLQVEISDSRMVGVDRRMTYTVKR